MSFSNRQYWFLWSCMLTMGLLGGVGGLINPVSMNGGPFVAASAAVTAFFSALLNVDAKEKGVVRRVHRALVLSLVLVGGCMIWTLLASIFGAPVWKPALVSGMLAAVGVALSLEQQLIAAALRDWSRRLVWRGCAAYAACYALIIALPSSGQFLFVGSLATTMILTGIQNRPVRPAQTPPAARE